jgi:biopolymer transport protein ExbB
MDIGVSSTKKKWMAIGLTAFASLLLQSSTMAEGFDWNWETVADQWEKGGGTMWWLLALSVAGVAFALERVVRLRRNKIAPKGFADRVTALWKEGKRKEIREICDRDGSVMAEAVAYIVRHRKRDVSAVSTGVAEIAVRELRPHMRAIYPLLVIATLAPLLGLFGTVVGLMEAFENFRLLGETGDPSIFAGSISKALVTTIVGLAIAMPAMAAYHFFKTKTNKLGDILETEASDLIDEWLVPEDTEDEA